MKYRIELLILYKNYKNGRINEQVMYIWNTIYCYMCREVGRCEVGRLG